jgi:hypothetical protein
VIPLTFNAAISNKITSGAFLQFDVIPFFSLLAASNYVRIVMVMVDGMVRTWMVDWRASTQCRVKTRPGCASLNLNYFIPLYLENNHT